jgi:uncharacterized DUF497 family protein
MADYVEWDPRKAAANLKKHGVDFADAALVFTTIAPSQFGRTRRERNGM